MKKVNTNLLQQKLKQQKAKHFASGNYAAVAVVGQFNGRKMLQLNFKLFVMRRYIYIFLYFCGNSDRNRLP